MEEQAKISLQDSGSFENAPYVFRNGQWINAGMRDHPTIKVCISMDNLWCRTRHAPIVARNVIAIANTGAQTNVWSLCNFLAALLHHCRIRAYLRTMLKYENGS